MARIVRRLLEPPHECPYLPGRTAVLDVAVLVDVSSDELGVLLERGWRRFGPAYFRPVCEACDECVSLRIPVAGFTPSRSQKRARRLASALTRTVGVPVVDDERLGLYARWHAQRESQRGWEPSGLTAERYAFDFAFDHPSVREVTFRDAADHNRLVGVGIMDDVPDALSAVYFFWDPEYAPPSLGVAQIVWMMEDAAARGLSYVYLGYWVAECASLAYKARYQRHEVLVGAPGLQTSVWRLVPIVADDGPR